MDDRVRMQIALTEMRQEAALRGVMGAAVVVIQDHSPDASLIADMTFRGRWWRPPDPMKEGDLGANYYSIAWSKIFEMAQTGEDSGLGIREPMKGELGLKGGVTGVDTLGRRCFAAFSGADPEVDVEIAKVGRAILVAA